jgi:hypothetical protein
MPLHDVPPDLMFDHHNINFVEGYRLQQPGIMQLFEMAT